MVIILPYLNSDVIYRKLDNLRKRRGLSVCELAKRAGVSSTALYKWRDKKSSPTLYLLESLCETLDIQIVNLLKEDDEFVFLGETEKALISSWQILRKEQRAAIMQIISVFIQDAEKTASEE